MRTRRTRTKIRRKETRAGVRWYVSTIDAAGKEHAHGGYRTRNEAKDVAAKLTTDVGAGRPVAPSRLTLGDYLESEWLPARTASGRIAPSTLESDRWAVRSWITPHVGDIPLQRLTASDLERFYVELGTRGGRGGRRLSSKTVRNVHLVLSKALGDAVRRGHVAISVATLAEAPANGHRTERAAWTREEARAFLRVADADRLRAVWRLMLATGIRRGETLGLTWDDIDLEERSVRIRRQVLLRGSSSTSSSPRLYIRDTTKGRRPRTIRFDETTREALKAFKAAQAAERLAFKGAWRTDGGLGLEARWVVTEADGKVVHPDTLHDRFLRLIDAAGVRRLVLHGTRHSFATIALAAGVRPDLVSRALGHASTGFTLDQYVHPSGEEELAAADVMGAVFGGPAGVGSGSLRP